MARLSLVYGLRLLPAEEVEQVTPGSITLKNGRSSELTLHLIEGENEEAIRERLLQSLDAFFDFYPEV